jgi:rhomboid protease GluP
MQLPPRLRWTLDRWKQQWERLRRGEKEQPRPKICPSCGSLVGATATRCHECGTSMTFSVAAVGRSMSELLPAESPVSYSLLLVNFMLFSVTAAASTQNQEGFNLFGGIDGEVLYRMGARETFSIFQGQWWRLVMPIFLHGSMIHILFNSLVLADLGTSLENTYGSPRYFFFYLMTGIFSFVVSTVWNVYRYGGFGISIGASGSLMGLMGMTIAITQRRGGTYMRMMRQQLIRWVLYIFVLGMFMATDNAAHLGGLAAGYVIGHVAADREPLNARERAWAHRMGLAAITIAVASFSMIVVRYLRGQS